jgi:phage-related tail fiber protein
LQVNQNTIFASGNQFIPASIKDSFPSQIYLTMRDAFGNLLSNAPVNLRVKDAANGCLKESPESSACQTELALQTDAEGRLKASFHWRGKVNMAEAAASVIISEAGTNAQITHNIQVTGHCHHQCERSRIHRLYGASGFP